MPDSVIKLLHQGDNANTLLLALFCLTILLIITTSVSQFQLLKLRRKIVAMTRGVDNVNLEQLIVSCMERVEGAETRIDGIESATAILQAQIPGCIQRVSMVRYDAFEDVGGQQSFSIALLDAIGDGVVLTSVFSRMDIRVYAKAIRQGRASHALSSEETQAIKEASSR